MPFALAPFKRKGYIQPLRSLSFSGISGVYAPVGAAANDGIVSVLIVCTLDAAVIISDDGVNDKFVMLPQSSFWYDANTNDGPFPGSTRIYAKQETSAPTAGKIYVTFFGLRAS